MQFILSHTNLMLQQSIQQKVKLSTQKPKKNNSFCRSIPKKVETCTVGRSVKTENITVETFKKCGGVMGFTILS